MLFSLSSEVSWSIFFFPKSVAPLSASSVQSLFYVGLFFWNKSLPLFSSEKYVPFQRKSQCPIFVFRQKRIVSKRCTNLKSLGVICERLETLVTNQGGLQYGMEKYLHSIDRFIDLSVSSTWRMPFCNLFPYSHSSSTHSYSPVTYFWDVPRLNWLSWRKNDQSLVPVVGSFSCPARTLGKFESFHGVSINPRTCWDVLKIKLRMTDIMSRSIC